MTQRYIIVGDVHGCLEEAKQLLRKVDFDHRSDTLISLGDLVDRGPDSAGCVELFYMNKAKLVQANHEDKLLRWQRKQRLIEAGVRKKKNDVQLRPHHKVSVDSLNVHPKSKELWDYMETGVPYLSFRAGDTTYDCVHGGYLPFKGRETDPKVMIRLRNLEDDWKTPVTYKGEHNPYGGTYWAEIWSGPQTIIFGHNVFPEVEIFPYAIGIDTGCAFGGKLTALVIDAKTGEKQFVSVMARRRYHVGYEELF